jgi:hypothetical protein
VPKVTAQVGARRPCHATNGYAGFATPSISLHIRAIAKPS